MVKEEIWAWMLAYQQERGTAPKMDEIMAAHPTLNWRSSVRHNIRKLVADGKVVPTDSPRTARRYRAVPDPSGTDVEIVVDPSPGPSTTTSRAVVTEVLGHA